MEPDLLRNSPAYLVKDLYKVGSCIQKIIATGPGLLKSILSNSLSGIRKISMRIPFSGYSF
tara:strand:- start:941 stop:1123 length:183 start_codon:yes stop_codon:yes gene_type:complete